MVTLGACGVAWSAVDRVAAQVTGRPPIVGQQSIRRSLDRTATGTAATGPDGATTAADGTAFGHAGGAVVIDPVTGRAWPAGATGTSGGATANGASDTGPSGSVDTPPITDPLPPPPPPPAAPPTPAPTAPPSTAPPSTATVFVTGGSVVASCSTGTPTLVSAIPNSGYGTTVRPGHQLLVTFTSATHLSVVETECEGTRVHFSTGEERDD